jgi:hypothetical protein
LILCPPVCRTIILSCIQTTLKPFYAVYYRFLVSCYWYLLCGIGTNRLLIYKLIVLIMELAATLKTFIEEGQDWERKHTSVKGVSIIRLPATKNRAPSLAIDINPIGSNGLPMKKKGIMIMNAAEIAAFRAAFNNEKIDSLIAALEEVLPERKSSGKPAKPDVLQI